MSGTFSQSGKSEILYHTLTVAPAFLDFYPALKVDFYLEETSAGSDDLFNLITNVRADLRVAKQYELSDKIRDELINLGYEIND